MDNSDEEGSDIVKFDQEDDKTNISPNYIF